MQTMPCLLAGGKTKWTEGAAERFACLITILEARTDTVMVEMTAMGAYSVI
jgi:hypothetical protein